MPTEGPAKNVARSFSCHDDYGTFGIEKVERTVLNSNVNFFVWHICIFLCVIVIDNSKKTSNFWGKKTSEPFTINFLLNFFMLQNESFEGKMWCCFKTCEEEQVCVFDRTLLLKYTFFSIFFFTKTFDQTRASNFPIVVFWVSQLSLTLTLFTKEGHAFNFTSSSKRVWFSTKFNTWFLKVVKERWKKKPQNPPSSTKVKVLEGRHWNVLNLKKKLCKTEGLLAANLGLNDQQAVVF